MKKKKGGNKKNIKDTQNQKSLDQNKNRNYHKRKKKGYKVKEIMNNKCFCSLRMEFIIMRKLKESKKNGENMWNAIRIQSRMMKGV